MNFKYLYEQSKEEMASLKETLHKENLLMKQQNDDLSQNAQLY